MVGQWGDFLEYNHFIVAPPGFFRVKGEYKWWIHGLGVMYYPINIFMLCVKYKIVIHNQTLLIFNLYSSVRVEMELY